MYNYVHGTLLIAMLTNETIQDMLQQFGENSTPEGHMMTKDSNRHEVIALIRLHLMK